MIVFIASLRIPGLDSIIFIPTAILPPHTPLPWIHLQLKAGQALCFYLSWQGSLTSGGSFPLSSNQICTWAVECWGRTQRFGGDQVKMGSHTVYLHLLVWCISPFLKKIRFVWSLLFPLLEVCVLCPIFALWSLKGPSARPCTLCTPRHIGLPYLLPDIPHYLGLCRKKDWRVIKLSLQVCCCHRLRWPSRGHRFTARLWDEHQEMSVNVCFKWWNLKLKMALRHQIMLLRT